MGFFQNLFGTNINGLITRASELQYDETIDFEEIKNLINKISDYIDSESEAFVNTDVQHLDRMMAKGENPPEVPDFDRWRAIVEVLKILIINQEVNEDISDLDDFPELQKLMSPEKSSNQAKNILKTISSTGSIAKMNDLIELFHNDRNTFIKKFR